MNRFAHRDDEEWCEGPTECVCGVLAEVRADEREKAARRVESCVNKFKARDFNDAVYACAAAIRGES